MEIQEIQEQLAQVRAEMATENQRGALADQGKILNLQQKEQELVQQLVNAQEAQYELQQQQEKEQRDQKQQEVIDNAVDLLPSIFEALLPQDTYAEILGLTQYGELRQQFYQLCRAYTAEQVQTVSQQYELELAQKDEKIRLLNKQSLEDRQQLDAANAQIAELTKQLQDEKDAHDKTQADLAATRAQLNTALSDNAAKDEKIAELQAKQPKAEPSANLQEMITKIKSTNTLSADDLIARWNARQKTDDVKLPMPEVPTVPATFPDAQPQNGTVSNGNTTASDTTIQPAEVTPPTTNFPTSDAQNQPAGIPVDQGTQGQANSSDTTQAVTREEFEALKKRVEFIEIHANIPGKVA
jgi:septal ring factor EnvC (AmiA/AmiB activator)